MIYILTDNETGRLRYVLSFIFEDVYSIPFRIIQCIDDLPPDASVLVVYGEEKEDLTMRTPKVTIPQAGLLSEKGVRALQPDVSVEAEYALPVFFNDPRKRSVDFSFDLFAMVFYCITRYEEYNSPEKDRYGRFPASASLAGKNGFLHLPLVDLWLDIFIEKLALKTGQKIPKKQNFAVFPTIDIDRVWAFAHKEKSHLPGLLKDILTGHLSRVPDRFRAVKNPETDPFFTFTYLDKTLSKSRKAPLYFVLFAKNPDQTDINHPRNLKAFQDWLKDFAKSHDTGLHPSCRSHFSPAFLTDEKNALEEVIHKPVVNARQHYILFRLPHTYRQLAEAGIQHDYSMGYPESIGYRASTGYSYHWYDLEKEKVSSLSVHPFQCMDVTMRKYMGMHPKEAISWLGVALDTAKKTDSPVRFIWHNSSFYHGNGWKNWDKVFGYLAEYANR